MDLGLFRRTRTPIVLGIALLLFGALSLRQGSEPATAQSALSSQIASLSEPGGYFDTDNLISNERSYLQVLPDLRKVLRGGAYVGVGPDQNFTYIAALRPSIAFIVDIRRDNLLLHLLFKALFELSSTRVEYLAHLFGRPAPPAAAEWRQADIERLAAYIDRTPLDRTALASLRTRVATSIKKTGVPLSADDLATIDRFHRRFVESGLDLQFQSRGRPPQDHYPTYRELLVGQDPTGDRGSYLASEDTFQFVKELQARDLIVPVVGDLSGSSALGAIGRALGQRGERLSAFYTSNVEFYLFRNGAFPRFVENLQRIPHARDGIVIRSVFGRGGWPATGSTSHVQSIDHLIAGTTSGRIQRYADLIAR